MTSIAEPVCEYDCSSVRLLGWDDERFESHGCQW